MLSTDPSAICGIRPFVVFVFRNCPVVSSRVSSAKVRNGGDRKPNDGLLQA